MRTKLTLLTVCSLLASISFGGGAALAITNDSADPLEVSKSSQQPIEQFPSNAASDQHLRHSGVTIRTGLKAWIDESKNPWCAILCIHGLTLHKDSYARMANRTSEMGIATYAMDVRGFGDYREIPGKDRIDFEATFEDIRQNLLAIRGKYPTLPVFLMGESMGGALALQASAKFPALVDGTLSSVPHANTRAKALLKALAIFAKGVVKGPNAEVDVRLLARDFTDKPNLEEKIIDDPRVRTKITVSELFKVKHMMQHNKKFAPQLTTMPVVIVQGWRDKLMRPNDSVDIMNKLGTPNKDLVVVGQNEHLILEEGQYTDYAMDAVLSWLDKASSNSPIVTPSEMVRPNEIVHQHKPDEEVFRLLRISQNMIRLNDPVKAAEYREKAVSLALKHRSPEELAAWFNTLPPQLISPPMGSGTEQILARSGLQLPDASGASVVLFSDSRMNERRPVQAKLYEKYRETANLVTVDIATADGAKVARSYGIISAPCALLLDSNHVVRDMFVAKSDKELKVQLKNVPVAISLGRFGVI